MPICRNLINNYLMAEDEGGQVPAAEDSVAPSDSVFCWDSPRGVGSDRITWIACWALEGVSRSLRDSPRGSHDAPGAPPYPR